MTADQLAALDLADALTARLDRVKARLCREAELQFRPFINAALARAYPAVNDNRPDPTEWR